MINVEFKNTKTNKHIVKQLDWKNTFMASNENNTFYISDKNSEFDITFSKVLTDKQAEYIDYIVDTFMDNKLKTLVFISNNKNDTVDKIIYNDIEINIC